MLTFDGAAWFCALLAMFLAAGCAASRNSAPPLDLTTPGWVVRQGQAVWRNGTTAADLAGELVLATHPDGRAYLQFAKPPVELASAALETKGWHLSLPLQRRNPQGRFDAAPLPGWVELLRREQGHPGTPGWRFKSWPDGRWELVHDATGERLEGFLDR